jgi:uncharacterized protein (TIGR02246 family)
MTHDESSIRALLARYEELLNASDAENIAALYTSDALFMPQGFPTAAGRETVLQSYRAIFENITLKIEFEVDEIVAGRGMATAVTRSIGSATSKRRGMRRQSPIARSSYSHRKKVPGESRGTCSTRLHEPPALVGRCHGAMFVVMPTHGALPYKGSWICDVRDSL